ncbi:hypothetical protein [Microcystis phage LMM01]|uniref:Uncharacterized protein n=1 Tax=Microcystis phage LMM01 TaxID=2856824 RepID=A0A7S2_9CAUD|nr:hypothetical protein MaLMM01_gp158 [Microcystis phage LMM01]BAF36249.1 hypothetical protein [Microcystis phage LMM01]
MHQNINTSEAIRLLKEDNYANWSWSGAQALVEYIEDLESSEDIRIEFDEVAFRCDFSEYSSALEAAQDYGFIPEDDEDEDDVESSAIAYLEDKTTVIKFEGGVIIQQF